MHLRNRYSDAIIISSIFFINHAWLLFMNGLYWDDWLLFNTAPNLIMERLSQVGLPWFGYFYALAVKFEGAFFYRFTTFMGYLVSALLVNDIFKKTIKLDTASRIICILFFAIVPLNIAKIAISSTADSLCYAFFWVGAWFSVQFETTKYYPYRLMALVAFFCAFLDNRFLFFYVLVILYLIFVNRQVLSSINGGFAFIKRYVDFILCPLVFLLLKTLFSLPSSGGGNFVAIQALPNCFTIVYWTFLDMIVYAYTNTPHIYGLLGIAAIGAYLSRQKGYWKGARDNTWHISAIGLPALILAIVPALFIIAFDTTPTVYGWQSRYQLLFPLGISYLLYYIFNNRMVVIRTFIYCFFVAMFTLTNISMYLAYQADWYKQLSLIYHFKNNELIEKNAKFIINDTTTNNPPKRIYYFYEYTGMMKAAFGNETRSVLNFEAGDNKLELIHQYKKYYNMSEYNVSNNPNYTIVIKTGATSVKPLNVLKMRFYETFWPDKFRVLVKDIVALEVSG